MGQKKSAASVCGEWRKRANDHLLKIEEIPQWKQ
jgi:hypothetical protein